MSFEGFEPANTTPVPDILFDELLTELSGAETKVLLYIIRRTWGFKKNADAISLSQLQNGIVTRDGKVLDKGCGIKRRETICQALASLEKKKCILSQKGNDAKGDKATSIYSIYFKEVVSKPDYPQVEGSFKTGLPVVSEADYGSDETGLRVVSKPDIQETVLQQTDKQETVLQDGTFAQSATAIAPPTPALSENKNETETPKKRASKSQTLPPDDIPVEALSIMADWDSLFKRPYPRTDDHIMAAKLLMICQPTKDDLKAVRAFIYKTNPEWYRDKGVKLSDIAKNFGKWQCQQEQEVEVKTMPPPTVSGRRRLIVPAEALAAMAAGGGR